MKKRGFLSLVLAAILGLAFQAAAAAPATTLPPRVQAHVSVQSINKLKRNLFRLVDSSTKGTKNHVPVEFLEMMTQMVLPFPLELFKADEQMHLIVLETGGSPNLLLLFSVDSFDDLVAGLEEAEFEFGEPLSEHAFQKVLPMDLPDGKSLLLIDLGDGKVAVADLLDDLTAIMNDADWAPTHKTAADISANIALDGENADLKGKITEVLEESYEEMIDSIEEAGISREVAESMLALAKKYFPVMAGEFGKATNLLIELTAEKDRLVLDFGVRFADGAYARKVAEHLAGQPIAASVLTAAVPGRPVSVGVSPDVSRYLPDSEAFLTALRDDIMNSFPAHRQELEAAINRSLEAKMVGLVGANYLVDGQQVQYQLIEMQDVAAGYEGVVAGIEAVGKTVAGFFADPEESFDLVGESRTRDGFTWHVFSIVPRNAEKFEAFLDRLGDTEHGSALAVQIASGLRLYVAALPELSALLTVGGPLGEDDFFSLLSETKKGERDWFAAPGAETVLADLKGGQLTRALLDADGAFLFFVAQSANAVLSPGEQGAAAKVLARMADSIEPKDVFMGIGAGVSDGWMLFSVSSPAKAVNSIILDYAKFRALLAEMEYEDDEEYEDDMDDGDESGEDDEEEIVLEAEDDAA